MAVKKLSEDIQSLFCSSSHLTTYKKAIEELVYNSLDAKASSIAIRIHLQENKIQVIDNGGGIPKKDFNLLGERHATSKFMDLSHFKAAPNTYGFRGQSLANIIDISEIVKITSKVENDEITWCKSFYNGKKHECGVTRTRPSKGTTVEINGFLYNLNIQKKAINPLQELHAIKSFLEQISLVHSNISLSLRDDSKNEIVFKVHKNRNIYQTFKTLFDIDESKIQELQVVKNEYKVVAYIGKDSKNYNGQHWLFLNKKFLNISRLHKLVNNQFMKLFHSGSASKKIKLKNCHPSGSPEASKSHIPFYFIFLSCPYYDYDISDSTNHSMIEFKCWETVNKLIEKLVKLYMGDIKLKEIKRNTEEVNIIKTDDTRDQVRKIMTKILGGSNKKLGASQLQNGVKGKLTKRNKKKISKITLSKVISPQAPQSNKLDKLIPNKNAFGKVKDLKNSIIKTKGNKKPILQNEKILEEHEVVHNEEDTLQKRKEKCPKKEIRHKSDISAISKKKYKRKKKNKADLIISAFKKPSDSIKRRCKMLAEEAENVLNCYQNRIQTVFVNETVNNSNIIKDNRNISIRKRINEIVIHDYIPLPNTKKANYPKNTELKENKESLKSTYDLIKPALEISQLSNVHEENQTYYQTDCKQPQLTFQSHNYDKNDLKTKCKYKIDHNPNKNCIANKKYSNYTLNCNKKISKFRFISKQSTDNFTVPGNKRMPQLKRIISKSNDTKHLNRKTTKMCNKKALNINILDISKLSNTSNRIESVKSNYTQSETHLNCGYKSNENNNYENCFYSNDAMIKDTRNSPDIGFTYTLTKTDISWRRDNFLPSPNRIINRNTSNDIAASLNASGETNLSQNNFEQTNNPLQVVFISNSNNENVEPLDICETAWSNNNSPDKELEMNCHVNDFDGSFLNFTPNNSEVLSKKIITQNENNIIDKNINLTRHKEMELAEIEDVIMESNYFSKDFEDFPGIERNHFNLKNRPNFLPKGMSPIFENCNSKNLCNYEFQEEYFENDLFNNFANDVQIQSDIYGAKVQNTTDTTTKDIEKVNKRLDRENASITFNSRSLKEARVLGQIDGKFIAALMRGKSGVGDYLVLFDQHAVHERIRLEKILLDYYSENGWKSIKLDNVTLKLRKDDIMYLHNYKDKFIQFGLEWTILNNHEISVHAIPEAVIGKNPRQVDKVIEAVKNLISEEIKDIKSQKGCVTLFPKSIMNLVFSEACRYAIKFGDRLSLTQCIDLVQSLSSCKTPFQCAHGRPVMAVITDIKSQKFAYKVHKTSIHKLKNLFNKNNYY